MEDPQGSESLDKSTSSKRVSRRVKRRSSRIDEESEIVSFGKDLEDDDIEAEDENEEELPAARHTLRRSNSGRSRRPTIPDRYPRRLTNPLIDDSKVTTMEDLVRITDGISFHRPDTYSVSYLARVLGVHSLLDEVRDNDVVGVERLLERLKTPVNQDDPDIYQIPERQVFTRVFAPDDDAKCVDGKWELAYQRLLKSPTIQPVPMSDPQTQKYLKIVNKVPMNGNAIRNAVLPLFDAKSEWMHNRSYMPYEAAPFEVANASATPSGWIAVDAAQSKIIDAMVFQLEWFGETPLLRWLVTSTNPVLNSLIWQQATMAGISYAISSVEGIPAYRSTKTASGSYVGDFRKTSPYLMQFFRPETTEQPSRHRFIAQMPLEQKGQFRQATNRTFSNTSKLPPTKEVRLRVNVEREEIEGYTQDAVATDTNPPLSILRHFALPNLDQSTSDEVTLELIKTQNELRSLEATIEPMARSLFTKTIKDRLEFDDPSFQDRETEEDQIMEQTKAMIEERKKNAQEMEEQINMDMEAVCNICVDGDITPGNQIIFCESCNVPVHQMCYGIEKIPSGDYYCVACRDLGRDRQRTRQPLSIRCELCPLPGGAFVKTAVAGPEKHWVHVVCAKWNGLEYVDREKFETIEDVTQMKINFRRLRIRCELCLGERGAMIKCTGQSHCKKWYHVTCARASGKMLVTHGENCYGGIGEKGWTLSCPNHTKVPIEQKNIIPVETMIKYAKDLPPEPAPPPEPRPFNELNGDDRNALLADPKYENALIAELLQKRFYGVRCEICDRVEDEKQLRCTICSAVFCSGCRMDSDDVKKSAFKCVSCRHTDSRTKEDENVIEEPKCCACVQVGGPLRPAFAKPRSRQDYWRKNEKERLRSFFGKDFWIHTVCAYDYVEVSRETGLADMTHSILSDGKGMVTSNNVCVVCGITVGVKSKCSVQNCCIPDNDTATTMHVTCARQAGLEVQDSVENGFVGKFYMQRGKIAQMDGTVHCYRHCGNEHNFRARLEDMVELEKRRVGKDLARIDAPMSFADASRLLNSAVYIMRVLSWAWRWAEWWIDFNSSWEPLLEPGQVEENMSKEELKIVESNRQQRCDDARRCRLAAFGAALRNRDYDNGDDFHREALDRALRAILHTKSLVGPMTSKEINFFVEWLGRAYRSKSRLLYMGEHKNRVSTKSPFCYHVVDGSAKFELGSRPLPGAGTVVEDSVFEPKVDEPDNFMQITDEALEMHRLNNVSPVGKSKRGQSRSAPRNTLNKPGRGRKNQSRDKEQAVPTASNKRGRDVHIRTSEAESPTKRKVGRPPKKRALEGSRSLSPKQETDDYLTRHFKARRGRRATIESRTNAAKSEPSSAPPTKRRRGRPPSKKKRADSVSEEEEIDPVKSLPEDKKSAEGSSQQAHAASDTGGGKSDPAADATDSKPGYFDEPKPDSFDVVKSRSRRQTRPLNLDETSGKTYDTGADTTPAASPAKSTPTRRTPRRR